MTSSPNRKTLDAIALELVWTRLISAVDEAAKVVVRTSFSTLSSEVNDFACALTDAKGLSLAQNTGAVPAFLGALPATARAIMAVFPPETMQDGDVYITNNPWIATGHLNDVSVVQPIFYERRIVGFATATAHMPDIGGRIRSTEARELFEEGFHIPPMRLQRGGINDASLIQLLRTNVRTPDQTEGDIGALVTAIGLMAERVCRTLDDHELDGLGDVATEIYDRSEAEFRRCVAALPDGTYRYAMQTDGLAQPFDFHAAVTIAGDRIAVDFTGTSPQQPRALNCVLAYTSAMAIFAFKALLLPDLPHNEGIIRAIEVTAPLGSLLNPTFPAPVGGRAATGHYVPALVFGALADVLPDRVRAASGSPLWILNLSGINRDGRTFANVFFFSGGTGAGHAQDGSDCLCWPSNIASTPVEIGERSAPILIHSKSLRDGSGGPGRHSGGRGQEIVIESEIDNLTTVFVTERIRFGAPGLAGGQDGARGEVLVDGVPVDTRVQQIVRKGSVITLRTAGGGGYGAATEG